MPSYKGSENLARNAPECTGVLLTNLGTPDAPTPGAVRRYLAEFLSDPRVVELPRWLWLPILHGVILNVRPHKSAHAYRQIWGADGSPLLSISRRQAQALQTALQARWRGPVKVALAMRYGNPSIRAGLDALRRAGARRLLVLPLYPQYSAATTGSTFDAVADELKTWRRVPELRMAGSYHDDAGYIEALKQSVQAHWDAHGRGDKLVLSFHGVPERYLRKGDPYHCQCQKTARLLTEALGLDARHWLVSFQSRFGRERWLHPYTDITLVELARGGTRKVDLICPGFAADCLETLEENNIRNRQAFLNAGGTALHYVPCLNDGRAHIHALTGLAARHLQGWPETAADRDGTADTAAREQQAQRARSPGAQSSGTSA